MDKINRRICELGLERIARGETWGWVREQVEEEFASPLSDDATRRRFERHIDDYTPDGSPPREELSIKHEGNAMVCSYTGPLISSLEELKQHVASTGVDLSKWVVSQWEQKAYPAWCANRQANLSWEGGRIEYGEVHQDGGLTIEQVFSVSATFIPAEPVAVRPVLAPVVMPVPQAGSSPKPKGKGRVERWLAFGDAHIGYKQKGPRLVLEELHDRRALEAFVQACEIVQPDGVIIGGDYLDLAEWSTHYVRAPHSVKMTQPALIEGLYWLARIRAAIGDAAIIYEEGNHEIRVRHFLHKHLEHATDLRGVEMEDIIFDCSDCTPPLRIRERRAIGLPAWLDLDRLGVEWVEGYPDAAVWLRDDVRVEHGDRAQVPGNTAKAIGEQSVVNTVFFHVHRREQVTYSVFNRGDNITVTSICPGGMMHTDGRLPGATPKDHWQQGWIDIQLVEGLEPVFNVVPIKKGEALIDGRLVVGTPARVLSYLSGYFPQYEWHG